MGEVVPCPRIAVAVIGGFGRLVGRNARILNGVLVEDPRLAGPGSCPQELPDGMMLAPVSKFLMALRPNL